MREHERRRFPALAALCVLAAVSAGGKGGGAAAGPGPGSLASEERAIVDYVDAHNDEALMLLERVVNINSGTMNLAGVREVGAVFRRELDALGFATRWEDGESFQPRRVTWSESARARGRASCSSGTSTPSSSRDSPFQRFERLDGTEARGPGVIDMKGGDVILVQTLRALSSAGLLDRLAITVVLSGDEEKPGDPLELARRTLVAAARTAEIAIGFEDGDGKPR